MALTSGDRLGSHEIIGLIGVRGMGDSARLDASGPERYGDAEQRQ